MNPPAPLELLLLFLFEVNRLVKLLYGYLHPLKDPFLLFLFSQVAVV